MAKRLGLAGANRGCFPPFFVLVDALEVPLPKIHCPLGSMGHMDI